MRHKQVVDYIGVAVHFYAHIGWLCQSQTIEDTNHLYQQLMLDIRTLHKGRCLNQLIIMNIQ